MQAWIELHANLLSGLAGIVTLLAVFLSPVAKHAMPALMRRRVDEGKTEVPVPSLEPPAIATPPVAPARPGHGETAIPIAVMPFDSLSSDSDDAYLADGISCELISALSRAGRLMVTPRSDSFALPNAHTVYHLPSTRASPREPRQSKRAASMNSQISCFSSLSPSSEIVYGAATKNL